MAASTAIDSIVKGYLARTPSAERALAVLARKTATSATIAPALPVDHLAFRTIRDLGGVASVESFFLERGWEKREPLFFEKKKLDAWWYSPPPTEAGAAPLPRIFCSELRSDALSPAAQAVVDARTPLSADAAELASEGMLASAGAGSVPWTPLTADEYRLLNDESEYAAWTMLHGWSLNHIALSVHRLGEGWTLEAVNDVLLSEGMVLNESGGVIKVAPDGFLRQSSTMSDVEEVSFAGAGEPASVAGSYIEFAERLRLPEFAELPASQVLEEHLRDGFEAGNADRIFESTFTK
mmetsp:Transcript_21920/g.70832  ORF Transcript_21920/g.70832 Transcript_21920/m.70832 type:complete len:295 (+) Transcript_21920:16-900(+)